MKARFSIAVLAVLLVAPSPCFALWGMVSVSRAGAKKLGMKVRATPAGPNHVRVELEFPIKGKLKRFTEGASSSDPSRVELRIGKGHDLLVTVPLREDRSKPGRIVVNFTVARAQLPGLSVSVMVAEELGGTGYVLRMKDFVEPAKGR